MFQYQCDKSAIFLPDEGYVWGLGASDLFSPLVPASPRNLASAANYHLMFVWAPQCEELLWQSVSEGWYYDEIGINTEGQRNPGIQTQVTSVFLCSAYQRYAPPQAGWAKQGAGVQLGGRDRLHP